MSASLLQLADELTAALTEFSKVQQIIQDANKRISESLPATYDMYALGGILHDLYHGMESICSLIVKRIDKHIPVGSSWHRELIDIVSRPSEITGRPAIIRKETAELLKQYLGFRHFFRHNYGFELDWTRLAPLWHGAPTMIEQFIKDIEQFINSLKMAGS